MKSALTISLLCLGFFWLAVYGASPLTAAIVVLEAGAVVALAFLYASVSSR
ncbi:MAG: hypothetical protein ACRDKX_01320 [Solirubrobacterales bacterium]